MSEETEEAEEAVDFTLTLTFKRNSDTVDIDDVLRWAEKFKGDCDIGQVVQVFAEEAAKPVPEHEKPDKPVMSRDELDSAVTRLLNHAACNTATRQREPGLQNVLAPVVMSGGVNLDVSQLVLAQVTEDCDVMITAHEAELGGECAGIMSDEDLVNFDMDELTIKRNCIALFRLDEIRAVRDACIRALQRDQ